MLALVAVLVAAAGWAPPASAASSLRATVSPASPGAVAAPAPAPVSLGIGVSVAAARGALPPTLRALAISLPDGVTTALASTPACSRARLEEGGPGACPAESRLGSGSASFIYVVGALRLRASTEQLVLLRGERSDASGAPAPGATATGANAAGAEPARTELLLYLRVTEPAPFSIVLPGALTESAAPAGPLLALDLEPITRIAGGGRAVVTATDLDLARGFSAGACPAGGWTFASRLEFVGGGVEQPSATAPCDAAAAVSPPLLRVSARDGTASQGARFTARLSAPATVRVTLERRTGARWQRVRRATFSAPGGASVLRIRRAGGRRLDPGRYRARVRAEDATGLLSHKRSVTFHLR